MASTTISPNMNLPVPNVGVDAGPDWANNINASLAIIDQHNHTTGQGVPIPPSGLNINSALTFQNNQATNLQACVFTAQSALSTQQAVYVSGVDLYYNDGSGNKIQMTTGGSVNATSSGISSGTATASFVSSVLVVNSATNTPANIQAGSILIGNNTAGSNFVTLQPQNALGSSYNLTLPTIPASQNIMTLDASGNMSAPYTVDGSTIAISANVIGIPNGAITTTQISSSASILGSQLSSSAGILGTQLSVSAGVVGSQLAAAANIATSQLANTNGNFTNSSSFSTSSNSFTTEISTSLTIIKSHNVHIVIQPTSSGGSIKTSGATTDNLFRITIAGTTVFQGVLPIVTSNLNLIYENSVVSGSVTINFDVQAGSSGTVSGTNMQLSVSQGA